MSFLAHPTSTAHTRPILSFFLFFFHGGEKVKEKEKITKRWLCAPGTVERSRSTVCNLQTESADCVRQVFRRERETEKEEEEVWGGGGTGFWPA